ncbi:MAG TPA: hypothetical protein VM389_00490 [Phycisphaerae bacterium]|nr:hypothetical protein [Phycisphaerae bacterium]
MRTGLIRTACVVAAVAGLGLCAASRADTVTKTDGTVYTGKIQEENRTWVVMEVNQDGKTFTIPILQSQIVKIERGDKPATPTAPAADEPKPVAAGPGYYPLPIQGEIGVEVQAAFLATALDDVAKLKPDYLVFVFDSEGGSAQEAVKLMDLIAKARRSHRVVGLIRRATSSAAAVALAVPELYIYPTGQIGDATGVAPAKASKVAPLDDASRALLRTRVPAEAKAAGHPALVAEGLVDPSLELAIGLFEGRKTLNKGRGGKVITTEGQPLVLSGADAVDAGLAKGTADDMAALDKALGLKEWHVVRGTGWVQMARDGQDFRRKLELAALKERRDAYMEKVGPRLEQIDKEIADARENGRKVEKDKRDLERRYERDVQDIDDDYKADLKVADQWVESNPGYRAEMRRRAKDRRDNALKNLRQRLEPEVNRIKEDIRKWLDVINRLEDEKKEINRNIPR